MPTAIGALTVELKNNASLIIPDEVGIDPSAIGATFSVFSNGNNAGTVTAGGLTFNISNNAGTDESDLLANAISNCINDTDCNDIGAATTALPVSLFNWAASVQGNDIELSWSTTAELDNDFYLIEHSLDGRFFTEFIRVEGAGTTGQVTDYLHVHRKVTPGAHYYRLSQQDYDGHRTSLGILEVNVSSPGVTASPNPVSPGALLSLTTGTISDKEALLLDAHGRKLISFLLTQEGSPQLTIPSYLKNGIYLLRVGETTHRLVVQR